MVNCCEFDVWLIFEWNCVWCSGIELGLLLVDIDYFKVFND